MVVVGGRAKARLHVHVNDPAEAFGIASAFRRHQASRPIGSATRMKPLYSPGPDSTQAAPDWVPVSHCVSRRPSSGAAPKTSSPAKVIGATPRSRRAPVARPSSAGSHSVTAANCRKNTKFIAWSRLGALP